MRFDFDFFLSTSTCQLAHQYDANDNYLMCQLDNERTTFGERESFVIQMSSESIQWNSFNIKTYFSSLLSGWLISSQRIFCSSYVVILSLSLILFLLLLFLSNGFVDKQATKKYNHPIEEQKQTIFFSSSK